METPEFLKVLQHFTDTTSKDAEDVLMLKKEFPFSQLLHTLSARICKDHGFQNSQIELQLAAVYAADRGVLKHIMEAYAEDEDEPEIITKEQSAVEGDIGKILIEDMQRLSRLRENFELLFADGATTSFQSEPPTLTVEVEKSESSPIKSKKERIVELAKNLNPQVANEPPMRGRRKRKDPVEVILDQIATSKEALSPESETQKEQIQLIDQFIATQPSISGTKDKQIVPEDLSTIKTGEFGDAIISETLVEILLKQGKKDKAVEVLKKLIWKFPQKKAYFASQIEELKK